MQTFCNLHTNGVRTASYVIVIYDNEFSSNKERFLGDGF